MRGGPVGVSLGGLWGQIVRIVDWGDGAMGRAPVLLRRAVIVLLLTNVVAFLVHDNGSSERATAGPAPTETEGLSEDAKGSALPAASGQPSAVSPITTTKASVSHTPTTPTTATTAAPSAATTGPTPEPYSYQVTVEPTCARVGEEITATIRVGAWHNVGLVASYADGGSHGTMKATTVGEDGVFVLTWRAPPAPGYAKLMTGATAPGRRREGTTTVDFRVIEVADTC